MRADLAEAKAMVAWAIRRWQKTMTPEELTEAIFDAPAMRATLEALQSGSAGEVCDVCGGIGCARCAGTALATPAKAAGGWKLVPVEGTWQMACIAGEHANVTKEEALRIYRAMVAASPSPDGERQEGDGQ